MEGIKNLIVYLAAELWEALEGKNYVVARDAVEDLWQLIEPLARAQEEYEIGQAMEAQMGTGGKTS